MGEMGHSPNMPLVSTHFIARALFLSLTFVLTPHLVVTHNPPPPPPPLPPQVVFDRSKKRLAFVKSDCIAMHAGKRDSVLEGGYGLSGCHTPPLAKEAKEAMLQKSTPPPKPKASPPPSPPPPSPPPKPPPPKPPPPNPKDPHVKGPKLSLPTGQKH